MPFLSTSIKILLIVGVIFFLIFSYACLIWTGRERKEIRNILGAMMVSILYTFHFLLVGFFLLLLASFFLDKPF